MFIAVFVLTATGRSFPECDQQDGAAQQLYTWIGEAGQKHCCAKRAIRVLQKHVISLM
jgi:hypothetical protein